MFAPIAGGDPIAIEEGDASQRNGAFSPDGRWLAYEELSPNGQGEVYVRARAVRAGGARCRPTAGASLNWLDELKRKVPR